MDSVETYRQIIKRLIREYAVLKPSYGEIDAEVVFDESTDHYELMYNGWNKWRRVHGYVLHLDIRDNKVWIQHDGTEHGIANDLVEAGVPPEQIVLAFKHPDERKHTGFAVA